jgi:uncharacterized protein (DUF4415 family)
MLLQVAHAMSEYKILYGITVRAYAFFQYTSRAKRKHYYENQSMKTNLVYYDVDLDNLPPLTKEQQAELAALAAMPDSEIDTSDIPEMTLEQFQNAVRGQFYKPSKTVIALQLDSDVLAWFKRQGKNYQARINTILRNAMLGRSQQ